MENSKDVIYERYPIRDTHRFKKRRTKTKNKKVNDRLVVSRIVFWVVSRRVHM